MPDHVLEYLDAYYDGELNTRLSQKVNNHLASCPTCQAAFQDMQQLSEHLKAYSLPDFIPEERFAAQVVLCLPREQEKPFPEKAIQVGWWLIPVFLLSAGIVNHAIVAINNALQIASRMGWTPSAAAITIPTLTLESLFSMLLNTLGSLLPASLQWFKITDHIIQLILSNFFLQLALGILYLCWITLWWINHTRQGSGQSTEQ